VDHGVTDRAEKHPLERTPTASADHHQAGAGRGVDQGDLCREVLDTGRHRQLGVGFALPVCCCLGEPVRRDSQLAFVDVLDLVSAGAGDDLQGR
jgi:hypothetical protein